MSDDYERMLAEFELTEENMLQLSQFTGDLIEFPYAANVSVAPSVIHGHGLFATQPFYEGETIAPAYIRGLTPAGRYANHAKCPNAQYAIDEKGDIYQVALRNIKIGDEITNDYRRNARVHYASAVRMPLPQITLGMIIDAMRIATRKPRLREVLYG